MCEEDEAEKIGRMPGVCGWGKIKQTCHEPPSESGYEGEYWMGRSEGEERALSTSLALQPYRLQ